jgi:mRNA interferase HigB
MRIITRRRLNEAVERHPDSASTIHHWHAVVRKAVWTNLADTRKTFPHADQVKAGSGKTVTIFNLTNKFRWISAIHYDQQRLYVLRVLTHAEYTKGEWRKFL